MGYRDDFYTVQNIIGYTGTLNALPTVYFQRGLEYGHITQKHTLWENVGREEVQADPTYRFDNYLITHPDTQVQSWRLLEWEGGKVVHASRNAIIRRQFFGPGDLLTLSVALYRCPDIKRMYEDDYQGRADARTAVHRELMDNFEALQSLRSARNYSSGPHRAIDRVLHG